MFFNSKKVIDKIYMGCGDDYKEGYIGCDIRKTKTAKIICKAWELSKYCENVGEIYSRHIVEHLTYTEFNETLKYWHKALKSGYNKLLMYFYLNRNGFCDIDINTVDKWHLVAVGYKI
ncbi:hypothetical protein [Brachyspira sp.]|uniref:hypothetical protein n=1 Tax=Brachyspira sp. TaxID=1977261 RepID=UPI003D7C8388